MLWIYHFYSKKRKIFRTKGAAAKSSRTILDRLQKGETLELNGMVFTPNMVLGPERKGIKLTYVTDSRPTSIIAEQAAEAIYLFVKECMEKRKKLQRQKNINI